MPLRWAVAQHARTSSRSSTPGAADARFTRRVLIDVFVIAGCVVFVLAGVAAVVRWGSLSSETPAHAAAGTGARSRAVRLARYAGVCMLAGVVAGLVAAGAGGRLVMRLLALTSPAESQGAITEGDAAIGEITLDGTLGFIAFIGPVTGILTGLVLALLAPLLPRGRAGGLALGVVLLVLAGSRIDPLRSGNFDFNLVGPDWLSVSAFVVLALFQGLVAVAVATRLYGHAPALPLSVSARAVLVGRAAVALVLVASLPAFLSSVTDILERRLARSLRGGHATQPSSRSASSTIRPSGPRT